MKDSDRDTALSNPFSTGNGGVKFENLVGSTYLVALLTKSIPRGLDFGMTTEVSFQQRWRGATVDDIIVTSEDQGTVRKLFLQIKYNLVFSEASTNHEFESVIIDAWKTYNNSFGTVFNKDTDSIGIGIGIYNTGVDKHLQQILKWAKSAKDSDEYCLKIATEQFSSKQKRGYLQIFRSQLTKAKGSNITDEELWEFMKSLVIIHFDLESESSREKLLVWNSLLDVLVLRDSRIAHNLFDVLRTVVEEKSSVAGTINRTQLMRHIQSRSINIKENSLSRTHKKIFSMPKRNIYFTGRDTLIQRLFESLQTINTITLTQVIVGLGGIGKTQIAIEYAYRYKEYYNVLWWLNSEDENTLFSDYIRFAKTLCRDQDEEVSNERLKDIAFEWLSSNDGWLLIFDNIDDWSKIEPYLPQNLRGHVLVTSRNQNLDSFSKTIPLECFSPDEAATYLTTRTGLELSIEAQELSAVLGNLPLALAHAAAYIKQKGKSFSSYLKMFREHKVRLLDQSPELPDYNATVATTWNLSFAEVSNHSNIAVKLLNWLTFTAPELIPRSLFDQNDIWSFDEFEVDNAFNILLNYSLIDVQNEGQTVSIHRLVQEVIQYQMSVGCRKEYIIEIATVMKDKFEYSMDDPVNWIHYEKWLSHILALIGHAKANGVPEQIVFYLVQKAGIFLLQHGRHLLGKQLFTEIITWIEQLEENQEYVVTHVIAGLFSTFGTYLRDAGDFQKSRKYMERVVHLINNKESASRAEIIAANISLAETLMKLTLFPYALELLFYSLDLLSEDESLPSLKANILNLIAVSYRDKGIRDRKLEDLQEADAYFEKAINTLNENEISQRLELAYILNNYGYFYIRVGHFKEAYKKCYRALQIEKQLVREEVPRLARIYNNLGIASRGLKKYKLSECYFNLALDYFTKNYGEDNYNVGLVLNSIGKLKWEVGNWSEAQEKFKKALLIYRNVLGENHTYAQDTQRYLLAVQEKVTFQEYENLRKR